MPVTDVTTDSQHLTMTLTADFAAPVERVWAAFADPRQLERFWGPPGWPATFTYFDHVVGGTARYYMASPTGEKARGGWEFLAINAPTRFEVLDRFFGEDGEPVEGMPAMRMTFDFEATDSGTRMTNTSYFNSADDLDQVVQMGAIEGSTQAMNQLDAVLQGLREYAQGKGTRMELMDDTHVRITRLIDGPRELVWRAHHDQELVKKWMLGPDGWEMTENVVGSVVGETYRTSWAPVGDTEGEPFGFEGEVLLMDPPRRAVTTEKMIGMDGPSTINDLLFVEEDGATLLQLIIEYPDKDTRDMILATGMVDGMESSYARLEREVISVA